MWLETSKRVKTAGSCHDCEAAGFYEISSQSSYRSALIMEYVFQPTQSNQSDQSNAPMSIHRGEGGRELRSGFSLQWLPRTVASAAAWMLQCGPFVQNWTTFPQLKRSEERHWKAFLYSWLASGVCTSRETCVGSWRNLIGLLWMWQVEVSSSQRPSYLRAAYPLQTFFFWPSLCWMCETLHLACQVVQLLG